MADEKEQAPKKEEQINKDSNLEPDKSEKAEEEPKPDDANQVSETKPTGGGGKACLWIGLLVLVVLIVGYFGLAWLLRTLDKTQKEPSTTTSTSSTTSSSSSKAGESQSVKDLVGTWETTCLTPDINSPWGEKHVFTFNSDGTAKHVRSSGESCGSLKEDTPQNYKVTIPAKGQIDFVSTDSGQSIYDSYELNSDNTLRFGHGFCNCPNTGGGKSGGSADDRITLINNYLVYQKKQYLRRVLPLPPP